MTRPRRRRGRDRRRGRRCSVAYHLAMQGWKDIVARRAARAGRGNDWHSAGFVGQLRSTISQTRMIMYSTELYAELERQTGRDPDGDGSADCASQPARSGSRVARGGELRAHVRARARAAEPLGAATATAAGRRPTSETAWLPGDGYLDPALLTAALIERAAQMGRDQIATQTKVTALGTESGRVREVVTDRGRSRSRPSSMLRAQPPGDRRMAGAIVPVVPMRHQYASRRDSIRRSVDSDRRDPDRIVYMRPEGGGLLVGGYARQPHA